jgi:hypothetical protein
MLLLPAVSYSLLLLVRGGAEGRGVAPARLHRGPEAVVSRLRALSALPLPFPPLLLLDRLCSLLCLRTCRACSSKERTEAM